MIGANVDNNTYKRWTNIKAEQHGLSNKGEVLAEALTDWMNKKGIPLDDYE